MSRPTRGPSCRFTRTGLSPALARLSRRVPVLITTATGLVRFRSPLLAESRLMSFPPVLRCFSSPGSLRYAYEFSRRIPYTGRVAPFGDPRINGSLASPRGFSQRATSFIASQCQGIHQMPLFALDRHSPSANRRRTETTSSALHRAVQSFRAHRRHSCSAHNLDHRQTCIAAAARSTVETHAQPPAARSRQRPTPRSATIHLFTMSSHQARPDGPSGIAAVRVIASDTSTSSVRTLDARRRSRLARSARLSPAGPRSPVARRWWS